MNPADYTLAMTGIEKMLTWIGLYRDRRRSVDDEKRKEMKIALESLVAAASKTRQYQATNRNIVPAQNAELAALWNKAAMDIWSIDVELAELYLLKGDYWSDPEGWTLAQKDDRDIQLDEVYRRGQEALRLTE
jgi:hypothetical protein